MKCPECEGRLTVVDVKTLADHVRRCRICAGCENRWSTVETFDRQRTLGTRPDRPTAPVLPSPWESGRPRMSMRGRWPRGERKPEAGEEG